MNDVPVYRFVENPAAQEVFCHCLHEVEVFGGATRFIPVVLRKGADGEAYAENPVTIILPNEAVGPAIALTWARMPSGLIAPAVGHLVRKALAMH
jgi:hypothetical protein